MIIIDTETTGLKPGIDELLQVSIINEHGDTLLDRYIRPTRCTEWPEAMAINHITPDMVRDCPTIAEIRDKIQTLINEADKIIGYNTYFDIAFLSESGIDVPDSDSGKIIDVMIDFAEVYGDYREDLGGYKWQKLTTAAAYYGYEWPVNAHNSLGDCLATLYVYQHMQQQRKLRPCPFCGSKSVRLVDNKALIRCSQCMAEISIMGVCYPDDIIAAYNRRAEDQPHGAALHKLDADAKCMETLLDLLMPADSKCIINMSIDDVQRAIIQAIKDINKLNKIKRELAGMYGVTEEIDEPLHRDDVDKILDDALGDDQYQRCDRCGTYRPKDQIFDGLCEECRAEDAAAARAEDAEDQIQRCSRCGTYVDTDSMYAGICAECQAEDEAKSKQAGWYKIEEIIKEVLPDE